MGLNFAQVKWSEVAESETTMCAAKPTVPGHLWRSFGGTVSGRFMETGPTYTRTELLSYTIVRQYGLTLTSGGR